MFLLKIKWFIQKLFRGYSDSDIWSLNNFIVTTLRKPLKAYIRHQEERGMSLPIDFQTDPAAWLLVLKKIEYAFDEDIHATNLMKGESEERDVIEHYKKVQEGFELFGKYLQDLWD